MENIDYQELLEEYKEMVSKYCIAIANVEIRLDDNTYDDTYFFDCNFKDSVWVRAGDERSVPVTFFIVPLERFELSHKRFLSAPPLPLGYKGDVPVMGFEPT